MAAGVRPPPAHKRSDGISGDAVLLSPACASFDAFENIVNSYDYGLGSRFPVKKIVDRVRGYSSPNKLETMDKIVRYLKKRDTSGKKKLSEVDFDFLKLFKMEEVPEDQKSAKKLENNLVGMESVKEQVRGIVDVMKYNKQRQRMAVKRNMELIIA